MSLKEIKQRIASVKNTQKITSAMKLISAAKLRRAQNAIENMRPYQQKLNDMLVNLISVTTDVYSPYSSMREEKHVAIIAVSSNSTLCGSYNSAIIRKAKSRIQEYENKGVTVDIYTVGKQINDALVKSGYKCNTSLMSQASDLRYHGVADVAYALMKQFADSALDAVDIVYTRFYSPARHEVVCDKYLPITIPDAYNETVAAVHDYIIEPDKKTLLQQLLPKVIALRLFTALLDAAASEHSARMMAMQTATDNADDLITELTREYNKGRQQAITNELLDMMSGSINQ